jgi:sigma-B regulation protein RsbU (phosphoserine phosphatase)
MAIGDVCGKGMGAALLMSNLQATVRAEVRAGGGPLAIGQRVNSTLHASTDPDKFVTLFLGHLDPATGRLNYVNAGHDAPILLRAGQETCEELAATGLPAGILPDAPLSEETVNLGPGDLLYGYTDGLREAQDPSGDEFSAERLMAALVTLRALPAPEIAEKITAEVSKFTAGGEPQDDMTQLVVRRESA